MREIEYKFGAINLNNEPLKVFDENNILFLQELSNAILKNKKSYLYSDLISVGYWARKANILKLKEENKYLQNNRGRGLCFHITPSNIPLTFVFSYFFSLLAGNSNIVRLPSRFFPQVDLFIELFNDVVKFFPHEQDRVAFISYPRNKEISENISKMADVRMIWGGDSTIKEIKNLSSLPHCLDISFFDRYSICIINCEELEKLSEIEYEKLVKNFYNDTYLMDQNACSSPQIIFWENPKLVCIEKFWDHLLNFVNSKYLLQDSVAIDKYLSLCSECISNDFLYNIKIKYNELYRLELKELSNNIDTLRGKSGFFYEYKLSSRDELFKVINEKFQTITYFGIDHIILRNQIVEKKIRGVDRIVPIGKALDMNFYWDGYNLLQYLSKIIYVE